MEAQHCFSSRLPASDFTPSCRRISTVRDAPRCSLHVGMDAVGTKVERHVIRLFSYLARLHDAAGVAAGR